MKKKENQSGQLLTWLALVLFGIVLIRFGFVFRFNILLSLFLVGSIAFGVYLFKKWQRYKADQSLKNQPEGKVKERIEYCKMQIQKINSELSTIRKDVKELQQNLQNSNDPQNTEEGQQLLKAFEAELELREAKRTFFESCIVKLNRLLNKYLIGQQLAAKKNKLQELREEHYEDLAEMEALRSDVEMDVFLLDDIDALEPKDFRKYFLE